MAESPNPRKLTSLIIQEVENSLPPSEDGLVDLYQIHRPEADNRHRGDALGPHRPRRAGKVANRVINVPASEIVEAQWVSCDPALTLVTEQPPYSMLGPGNRVRRPAAPRQHGSFGKPAATADAMPRQARRTRFPGEHRIRRLLGHKSAQGGGRTRPLRLDDLGGRKR